MFPIFLFTILVYIMNVFLYNGLVRNRGHIHQNKIMLEIKQCKHSLQNISGHHPPVIHCNICVFILFATLFSSNNLVQNNPKSLFIFTIILELRFDLFLDNIILLCFVTYIVLRCKIQQKHVKFLIISKCILYTCNVQQHFLSKKICKTV